MSNAARPLFDATTKRAFVVAGMLVAVVAAFLLYERHKRQKEQAAIDAIVVMVQRFKSEIEVVVQDDYADTAVIQAALDRIEREQEKWRGFSTQEDIAVARMRLIGRLRIVCPISYSDEFNVAKEAVAAAESRSAEELLRTKQKLGELEINAATHDVSHPQMLKDWKVRLDHLLVARLRDEANAFAALPTTTPHQGLAKYAAAEDYVLKALIDATKSKNQADETEYAATYKALLAESDAFAAKAITFEFIDAIPWKDLLDGEMAMRWSRAMTVPSSSRRIENGVMTLTSGVTGIFDQKTDDLRHFVFEMEFAVEGMVTMFIHVSPNPQNPDNRQSHTFDLVASPSALVAGRTYALSARYVGSDLVVDWVDPTDKDGGGTWRADPSWAKLRKGGIAFLVPEGARLVVTRMRIKELR